MPNYKLISLNDCHDSNKLNAAIQSMQTLFAAVFAEHYKACFDNPNLADDFSDLDLKLFAGNAQAVPLAERARVLHQYFYTNGFSDEAAFLRIWQHLQRQRMLQRALPYANKADRQEWNNYLSNDIPAHYKLKEIDFILLQDKREEPLGFFVAHEFFDKNTQQTILHVRQGAVAKAHQHSGVAAVMGHALKYRYPHAIFECNRRSGNVDSPLLMMVQAGLMTHEKAVLGYSTKYVSHRSKNPIASTLFMLTRLQELQEQKAATQQSVSQSPQRKITAVAKVKLARDWLVRHAGFHQQGTSWGDEALPDVAAGVRHRM